MAYRFVEVEVSALVEAKIGSKHGLSVDDVSAALSRVVTAAWDNDPERGRRLLVLASMGKDTCMIVLYPVDEDAGLWHLASGIWHLPTEAE